MKNKSLFVLNAVMLLLAIGGPTSHAQTSADEKPSAVVEALNREVGGGLSTEEIALIQKVEKDQLENSNFTKMSLVEDTKRMNFLICISGRGALIAKGRMGACSSLKGKIYNLLGYGAGLSAGTQVSIFGLAIMTAPGQTTITGEYGSATTVAQSGLGFVIQNMFSPANWKYHLNALVRFVLVFGGPEFAVAQSEHGYLVMAGVGIGPMFDLGMEKLMLADGPEI